MTLPGCRCSTAAVRSERAQCADAMLHHVRDVTVVLLVGYSLAFGDGGGLNAFIGGLTMSCWHRLAKAPNPARYLRVFALFQMTFAIITPALIVGGFAERMRFSAVVLFSSAWLILVYAPICHWVWGGGWLSVLGVMDFAGALSCTSPPVSPLSLRPWCWVIVKVSHPRRCHRTT